MYNKVDVIDGYSDMHPTIAQLTCSSRAHNTVSKRDCILDHKANHFQRME